MTFYPLKWERDRSTDKFMSAKVPKLDNLLHVLKSHKTHLISLWALRFPQIILQQQMQFTFSFINHSNIHLNNWPTQCIFVAGASNDFTNL
uniref:Putative ovule protein n=1 Tax=Solanum chacoense TaxID=4108 RepID=A0A0V0GUH5_SOLCH